eukprot:1157322-Pelagomonas_calceolata.AAC.1
MGHSWTSRTVTRPATRAISYRVCAHGWCAQVMHMIVQVMLANPTLQHAAVSVMEACVKRPDSVPGVVEFLKRNPEKGLVSLYDALQCGPGGECTHGGGGGGVDFPSQIQEEEPVVYQRAKKGHKFTSSEQHLRLYESLLAEAALL